MRLWKRWNDAFRCHHRGLLMLVKRFKFKRNTDKGGFRWNAESEIERPGFYRKRQTNPSVHAGDPVLKWKDE